MDHSRFPSPEAYPFPQPGYAAYASPFSFDIDPDIVGVRLDLYLASQFPEESRSFVSRQIQKHKVLVNGNSVKPGYRLKAGDTVHGCFVQETTCGPLRADKVPFDILWEDQSVLVLAKPPGVVVHPAAGNTSGTLVNGLLFHNRTIAAAGDMARPGIVHRLDKDTSGIMVCAKTDTSHRSLVQQFKMRSIKKEYLAILDGVPEPSGTIDLPIGRHPVARKKMAIRPQQGKPAATTWRVVEHLQGDRCYVSLTPVSGRTHQLRVHMAHLKTPICGDAVYGKRSSARACGCTRQMLHAYALAFDHPIDKRRLRFTAPLWPDMEACLNRLRLLQGSEQHD